MYAEQGTGGYVGGNGFSPGGLAAAVAINVAVVGALMVAAPLVTAPRLPDPPIEIFVPVEPVPPPPEMKRAVTDPRPAPTIDAPQPIVERPADTPFVAVADPLPPAPFDAPAGTGVAIEPSPPRPAPVLVGPAVDPRYAGDFQPAYPPSEQRAGNAGRVTVRVLVGADGRVKQVERVSATSDAFFRATEQRALSRWRFRAATRDGIAEAAWRTMTVTFVLSD